MSAIFFVRCWRELEARAFAKRRLPVPLLAFGGKAQKDPLHPTRTNCCRRRSSKRKEKKAKEKPIDCLLFGTGVSRQYKRNRIRNKTVKSQRSREKDPTLSRGVRNEEVSILIATPRVLVVHITNNIVT